MFDKKFNKNKNKKIQFMKKLFITALVAVAISVSSFANGTNVTIMVMNHFSSDFRGAENVKWTVTSKFTKAVFEMDDKKMEAFYSTNGEFMGASSAIHFSKLPKKAIKKLAVQYPAAVYKLEECIEFTNAEEEKNYYVSYLTEKGKVILQINSFGDISFFK
jgi:hypothetical protein